MSARAPLTGGTPAATRAQRTPWRTILLLAALSTFGPLSMDLYLPVLPELASHLGTSDTLAQATMSVCMIGLGLGQLVAGPLSDRYGRRIPLLIGIALFALLSVLCAFAPSIELLLAARLAQGLAGSAGLVVTMAIARDLFGGVELSRILSLLMTVGWVAPIVAPLAGGQLAHVMDWRGLFLVLAGIGAILFVLALVGVTETLPHAARHSGGLRETMRHLGVIRRDSLFLVVLVISACEGAAFFSYLSMSSFVLQDEFGVSVQEFSLIFAANSVAAVIGAQINRALVGRAGPVRMYASGIGLGGVAGLGLLAAVLGGWGLVPVLITLCAYLLFTGVAGPNSTTLALDGHAERAGTAAAVLGVAGFVVGPIVAPLVSLGGATAEAMALTVAVAAGLAGLLVWLVALPLHARRLLPTPPRG